MRNFNRLLIAFTWGLGLLIGGCSRPITVQQNVRLMLDSDWLEPTTTFELRFDEAMVPEGHTGLPAADSPLVIRPALPGQFAWLSQRSGVYTPTEPPRLGQTYELALRYGLTNAAGQTASARLLRRVKAPPFKLQSHHPPTFNPNNAPSQPEIQLVFNARLKAGDAGPYLEFQNRHGDRVEAVVKPSTTEDEMFYFDSGGTRSALTWQQRFEAARNQARRRPVEPPKTAANQETPAPATHRLQVAPAKPLPLGPGWRLIIRAGLPSVEYGLRTVDSDEVPVGDVTPFHLSSVEAENGVQQGKRIQLRFSKPLAPTIDATNVSQWIGVTPHPEDLKWEVSNNEVQLAGRFSLFQEYQVTVKTGFPAAEDFQFKQNTNCVVTFSPLPPRLYFPGFVVDQLSLGRRQVDLMSINLKNLRVRAKLLDPSLLVHALRGYESYFRNRQRGDWDDPYREVDYNVVAGKTVFDQRFEVKSQPDVLRKTTLAWDEILKNRKFGVVFLAAENDPSDSLSQTNFGTQMLIQLTDLGVVWKTSKGEYWTHLFSYETGKPVAGAEVKLFTEENEPVVEARTDAEGNARLPRKNGVSWLVARLGEDARAVHLDNRSGYQLPLHGFDLTMDWTPVVSEPEESFPVKVFMFSDRPLYRPGEVMHLKGLLRRWNQQRLAIPDHRTGRLECFDARDRMFFSTNVASSALGAWDLSVPLPSATRGEYRVQFGLTTNRMDAICEVSVQEYQPNAFELKTTVPPALGVAEPVKIPVSARYYLGQKLSQAKLRWNFSVSDGPFYPVGFEDFQFCRCSQLTSPEMEELGMGYSYTTSNGEVDFKGEELRLKPEIPFNEKTPQPRSVMGFLEMTDLNQQTVTDAIHFTRHASEFYLGIKQNLGVLPVGEQAPIQVIAVRPDGTPYVEPVKARVVIRKLNWRSVRRQGAGGTMAYQNQLEIEPVLEGECTIMVPKKIDKKWQIPAATPAAEIQFKPETPGSYVIQVSAVDAGGRKVETSILGRVSGSGALAWNYRNEAQIELTPDRERYVPGRSATILVKTPLAGPALVTVEREQVLRSFVTNLTGNAPAIQIPLSEGDTPNVYVSVLILRGAADSKLKEKMPEYRLGYCRLEVSPEQSKLNLDVQTDAADYRPGQTGRATVEVTDAALKPVRDAEVTLFAVDEGILSLTGFSVPDPFGFFYALQALGVWSSATLRNILPEDPALMRFSNKGYVGGGGGGSVLVRKNFLGCAFWQAALRTDEQGKITVPFTVPDSLTRYRVVAVVHTAQGQFASSQNEFRVNKPVMIDPALPRFANEGDRLLARGVVHNRTPELRLAEATLELDERATNLNPTELGGKEGKDHPIVISTNQNNRVLACRVKVPANGSAAVEFPILMRTAGSAQWVWRARFVDENRTQAPAANNQSNPADFVDAVQTVLPIGYPAPLLHEVYLGRSTAETTNLMAIANPQLLEGQGQAAIRLANTRLLQVDEAVSRLLHYPYGCLEQTVSSLLPWLALRDFYQVLRLKDGSGTPAARIQESQRAIQRGLDRILSMQTVSGGLAFWPGGQEPMLWASAYGTLAIALVEQAGFGIPQHERQQLLAYIRRELRTAAQPADNAGMSDRCLAVYALAVARHPEPAGVSQLFEKRHLLSLENRALLALACLEGAKNIDEAGELLNPKTLYRFTPKQGDACFGIPARELAIQLLAWSKYQPAHAQVDTLVAELLKSQEEGHWTTTQGDAWAMLALSQYAALVENQLPQVAGSLNWGAQAVPFALEENRKVFDINLPITPERATAPLVLMNPGRRLVFSQVTLEARPKAGLQPRQDRGFSLQRWYSLVDDEGRVRELKQVRVGDRILVTLQLEVRQTAHYLAIDDPWPMNLEGINPEFKTQQMAASNLARDWMSDFRELRHDRILYFRNHLPPGSYTIHYLARVRAAGEAIAPAAKVEEMYHPERFGLSESVKFSSQSLE